MQKMNSSVLVTGGTGFVGRAVCDELVRGGWSVTIGVREGSSETPAGVQRLEIGDMADFHRGMDLSDFAAVVHLAAQVHVMSPTPEQARAFEALNAKATGELALAAAASGVGKFVFMSSIKVNGESTHPGESFTASGPLSPADPYARSKLQAEQLVAQAATDSSMKWVALRPPLVYGPGVRANFGQLVRLAGMPIPLPFGAVSNRRSLVYVGNLADAVAFVLKSDAADGDVFLVRDGMDVSTGDLIARIRNAAGRRMGVQLPIPSALLRGLARLTGQRRGMDRLTTSLQIDDSPIRAIGWRPPFTLREGLSHTVGTASSPRRLLFLVTEDWYFCSHRLSLARAARDAGWEVHVACRVRDHATTIQREGFRLHPLRLSRGGTSPVSELVALREIWRVHRKVDPDLAHHVAMKPVLYGGLVARRAGGPQIVNAVAGLGSVFSGGQGGSRLKAGLMQLGFRAVLSSESRWLVVQNADDLEFFESRGLARPDRRVVIPGSGVDADLFVPSPHGSGDPVQVTLVARMLWDKGVGDAVAATRLLRDRGISIRLWLVGDPDPENPNSIDEGQLRAWDDGHTVEWLGRIDDIPGIWAQSHIALLPSYREGMPRSLLEAASSGLPLVATDVPGCRSLVRPGVTGVLVEPRDPEALADAIEELAKDPAKRSQMGEFAREDVLANYSDNQILGRFLDLYDWAIGRGYFVPRLSDLRESRPRRRVQPASKVNSSV